MAREMKDSGIEWIGEIPREWKICRLRFLCNILTGNQDTQDNDPDGKYPFYVRSPIVEKSNSYTFEGDDILMAGDGVGAGKVFHYVSGKYGCHQRVYSLQKISKITRRFLYYYLQNRFYISIETANSKSTVDSVRLNMLQDFSVTIPNSEEQQSIADFLDTQCAHIDSVIEKTRTAIEEYKKLKQAVITQAVTKGIRPNREMKDSGIEWVGEIPKEWKCVKFKYIAKVKANLVHPDDYKYYLQVSPENIEKGTGKLLSCKTVEEVGVISDNHLFYKGQLLYSKIRPILNKVTIAPFDGLCSADMYPIETSINKYYLLYALLSDSFLVNISLITEDRVKMPKINQEELTNIFFNIPSDIEQSEIVAYLDEKTAAIDSLIQKKEQLITELEAYKKSLIYEYVTGKKEVEECQGI